MSFNKQMVHVIERGALARRTDLGKIFWYSHSNCAEKSGWLFRVWLPLKIRIHMSFCVFCILIVQKYTKTKFHRILEEEAEEKEYRDGLNDPDQSRKCMCASDQRVKNWLRIVNVFSGSRQVQHTLVRYILSSCFYSLGADI